MATSQNLLNDILRKQSSLNTVQDFFRAHQMALQFVRPLETLMPSFNALQNISHAQQMAMKIASPPETLMSPFNALQNISYAQQMAMTLASLPEALRLPLNTVQDIFHARQMALQLVPPPETLMRSLNVAWQFMASHRDVMSAFASSTLSTPSPALRLLQQLNDELSSESDEQASEDDLKEFVEGFEQLLEDQQLDQVLSLELLLDYRRTRPERVAKAGTQILFYIILTIIAPYYLGHAWQEFATTHKVAYEDIRSFSERGMDQASLKKSSTIIE